MDTFFTREMLALDAWDAANANFEAAIPPVEHAKTIPNIFAGLSGIFWMVSYILMTIRAFKDRSYAMPIYCLCLNITWEFVYGFIYGPGLGFVHQAVFGGYMIIDLFLFYAIVKSAPYQWRNHPLVAKNLTSIIIFTCAVCLWLQLAIAVTFIPTMGRQVVFFTAWPMQVVIGVGSIAQILVRGNTSGHSWSIWWTRTVGTIFAGIPFYWRIVYWPERFGYAWSPYAQFLLLGSHLSDFLYPLAYIYVQKYASREETLGFNGSAREGKKGR